MGQTTSSEKNVKFGGYKNSKKPRPGYYISPTEIYYRGKPMNIENPSRFEKLGNSWAKDDNHVYFQGKIVNGADSDTFVVNNRFGSDKGGKWYNGKLV